MFPICIFATTPERKDFRPRAALADILLVRSLAKLIDDRLELESRTAHFERSGHDLQAVFFGLNFLLQLLPATLWAKMQFWCALFTSLTIGKLVLVTKIKGKQNKEESYSRVLDYQIPVTQRAEMQTLKCLTFILAYRKKLALKLIK